MSVSQRELVLAYRRLYKGLLHAVQYSQPARYVVRDRMRRAFSKSTLEDYNADRIERTLEFLDGAARVRGLEHKILKNLMHIWHEQRKLGFRKM